jgi:hypothetical protein
MEGAKTALLLLSFVISVKLPKSDVSDQSVQRSSKDIVRIEVASKACR